MENQNEIQPIENPNMEIWAKAAELRELLKQLPPQTHVPVEVLELKEVLARLERLQALSQ